MKIHGSIKDAAVILVVIAAFILTAYAIFLWFVFLPFRLAMRKQGRAGGTVRLAELESLSALAIASLALLRSRQQSKPMNRRQWRKEYRALMHRRPDDEIPF